MQKAKWHKLQMTKAALAITAVFLVNSCTPLSPFTSTPGYLLMGHDYLTKSKRMEDYSKTGDVYSQYELGMMYCCGNESWHDNAKAMKWLCMAAKNGYSKAQFELGKIYENTRELDPPPLPTDNTKAYFWYSVADQYMNFEASSFKKDLESRITKAQINKAKEMLKNWRNVKCG